MRIISLLVGFLLIAAVGVFADTSVIIPGAPEWLNSLLATLGLAGVGGVGVFAVIARKIASVEAKYLPIVQALKSTIDKDANLFSTLKATNQTRRRRKSNGKENNVPMLFQGKYFNSFYHH